MRKAGAFLLGAIVAGWLALWLSVRLTQGYADSLKGNPSIGAGFGAGIIFLWMLFATVVVAAIGGWAVAKWLAHPVVAIAGYVVTLGLGIDVALLSVDYRADAAEAQRRSDTYSDDYERRMAPQRSAEARARAQANADAQTAIAVLLGPWMPEGGKVDIVRMSQRPGPPEWNELFVSTEREKAESVMTRIAPDGWFPTENANGPAWEHRNLVRPGDGVSVTATVFKQGRRILLCVYRPTIP